MTGQNGVEYVDVNEALQIAAKLAIRWKSVLDRLHD